ncbi:MAG: hypothetical protein LBG60_00895 [Bifidobacteriaceae bacterium]|nr:hypothetical protein [Bifidobacteriaceae bacterium]
MSALSEQIANVTIDRETAARMLNAGWEFDWSLSVGASVQKVGYLVGDQLQGLVQFERVPESLFNFIYLIEAAPWNRGRRKAVDGVVGVLFATVAQDSLDAGFDGFVAFKSKTVLKDHYVKKYGAKVLFDDQLFFDTAASLKLIADYLGGDDG